jgi:uncharacterized protein YaaN involved in tellurite resistance
MPADVLAQVDGLVAGFVDDVAGPAEREAAVRRRLVDLAHLGAAEVVATTRTTGRIAERATDGGESSRALATALRDLRQIVAEIDPRDPDRFDAFLARYGRLRGRVDAALGELGERADALALDVAARGQDERSLAAEVASLRRYVVMAGRLDRALARRLDELEATDPARARRLRDDVLLPVRSRRRDLLVHLDVATQSLLGLRSLVAHDETLREAVSLVRTTMIAALDAAAVAARLLAERRDRSDVHAALEDLRASWTDAAAAMASAAGSID